MAIHDAAPSPSVLGPSTRITGHVRGEGDLRIAGRLEGNASVTGRCELAAGAEVRGDIEATSLEVEGTLTGDVNASGPVLIRAGAVVAGTVRGERVAIEPGASVSVRLDCDFELDDELPRRGGSPTRR